jgi:DNA-binding GntR family transcriptional regulator
MIGLYTILKSVRSTDFRFLTADCEKSVSLGDDKMVQVALDRTAEISPPRILKQDLVRLLLLDVFAGEVESGDRLIEASLAERFGVSRTPIREALFTLSAIGIVELRPNCGAVMRPFGLQQVREIYEIREVLEADACRRACGRIAPMDLKEQIESFEALAEQKNKNGAWSQAEWAADKRLHFTIAAHCANTRLAEVIAMHNELIQIVRETVGNQRRWQEVAVYEHLAILKPLYQNKTEAAAQAMRDHIHAACAAALDVLKRHLD